MKKMKLVNVYGGYGENDIMEVEKFEGWSIEDGVNKVRCKGLEMLMIGRLGEGEVWDEDVEYGVFSEWKEFYSNWVKYSEDLCGVSFGEENFYWVIGEGSEWYDDVDNSEVWSDSKWEKWEELCYGYCDE